MINNDGDNMIFYYPRSETEIEEAQWNNTALHMMIFFWYSADIDSKTAVKRWYDVDVTILRSFSGPF